MKKNHFIALVVILLIQQNIQAYNYLNVRDPQNWLVSPGKIDAAALTITPGGLFFKYDLEMTISAAYPDDFWGGDLLEIEFFFSLPENSMVIESFLWVGDSLVRAELRDTWSAYAIYESIVSRQKDPSVLYKKGPVNYELRVYPMKRTESRTVKLTFLVPARLTNSNCIAGLPMEMLNLSKEGISDFSIIVNSKDKKNKPVFIESGYPDFTYGSYQGKTCWYNKVNIVNNGSLSVAMDSPLKDGIYLSTLPVASNEGIFQLALAPSSLIESDISSKILVVLDYDVEKTTFTKKDLIQTVKSSLINNMMPVDSFNFIYSRLNPAPVSGTWLPADSAHITEVFKMIDSLPMANYSLLPATLAKALEYVDIHGGDILIITSSNKEGEYKSANLLIQDLLSIPDNKPVIHAVNFSNFNTTYFYQNGYNYYGDEYFLSVLAGKTGGNYLSIKNYNQGGLNAILDEVFNLFEGTIINADLYTDCKNGFCFSKYLLNDLDKGIPVNSPIVQIGKYIGEPPFSLDFSGMINNSPFSETKSIGAADISASDPSLLQYLAGFKIKNLEGSNNTNNVVNEIINESLDNHVLSYFTAFLALEPGMDPDDLEPDDDELIVDGEEIFPVGIEDFEVNTGVTVSPNPFTDFIEIDISKIIEKETIREIYVVDILGHVVHSFDITGDLNTLTWNGIDDRGKEVENGLYFLILSTDLSSYKTKILKIN